MRISDWSSDVCSSDLILKATFWHTKPSPEFFNCRLDHSILAIYHQAAKVIQRDRISRLQCEHHAQIHTSVVIRTLHNSFEIVRKLKLDATHSVFRDLFPATDRNSVV